ncbi:hypothetical protein [Flavobacterium sp. ACN6]|uniref:hypothetical protein n=1 Tax=Flavobacterium sp. ACN6 TaxID=1920426 RepID=UPI000BB342DD|nr:hypothetical protein [Flavobacterium sp. ACN6]PBJ13327.1 hypothetical protein BSF42_17270 [Flavobacterium sp. ACN6]
MKKTLFFFLLIYTFCHAQKKQCIDKNIKIEYLSDIDKLIKSKYICDASFETFGKDRLEKCKVLFCDKNYKVSSDQYKTRIFVDKKLKLNFAIVCIIPDFKIRKETPNSLYLLDDRLMPIYSISKSGEKNYHVFKYEYVNGNLITKKAIDKESQNINIDQLTYKKILSLVSKIKGKFTFKTEKESFDDYFYDVPLWTEGYR